MTINLSEMVQFTSFGGGKRFPRSTQIKIYGVLDRKKFLRWYFKFGFCCVNKKSHFILWMFAVKLFVQYFVVTFVCQIWIYWNVPICLFLAPRTRQTQNVDLAVCGKWQMVARQSRQWGNVSCIHNSFATCVTEVDRKNISSPFSFFMSK